MAGHSESSSLAKTCEHMKSKSSKGCDCNCHSVIWCVLIMQFLMASNFPISVGSWFPVGVTLSHSWVRNQRNPVHRYTLLFRVPLLSVGSWTLLGTVTVSQLNMLPSFITLAGETLSNELKATGVYTVSSFRERQQFKMLLFQMCFT